MKRVSHLLQTILVQCDATKVSPALVEVETTEPETNGEKSMNCITITYIHIFPKYQNNI